jgi:pimeloyl-ACP methyl ester carboxylesterase
MRTAALFFCFVLLSTAQAQKPTTGYAPVNGLKMYYEIYGDGEPIVLLHGAFMSINGWSTIIPELAKTRKVIAVEMQAHGRTQDIQRDFTYDNLADDVAALLDYLKIKQADVFGYSLGGCVALQTAIRHPEKVRKAVILSAVYHDDGWVDETDEIFKNFNADMFRGSPIEIEYKKLSPTPDQFDTFIKRVSSIDNNPYNFGASKLKATKAPMLFINGDADGVKLTHIIEMFQLKGGGKFGDLGPRSDSQLAIIPNTAHIGLMDKAAVIVPMINDFLNAKPKQP